MTQHDPEPLDESPPPTEIRGGNRPEDYIPTLRELIAQDAGYPLGTEEADDDGDGLIAFPGRRDVEDESVGGNDPDAQ